MSACTKTNLGLIGTVFALFQAIVRIVDKEKRDKLSRMLFDEARQTVSGEKLEEKLAFISLSSIGASSEYYTCERFHEHPMFSSASSELG